CIS
ncbi:hypothetical protein D049_3917B, partial [Vibrio parahaemolyticus VPTS-2010]